MPTSKSGYFVDGSKVPSVTQIVGRFKDSGALIYWAWTQGRDGKDFRETTQKAADSGTICHAMVECDLKGIPYTVEKWYEDKVVAKAREAFQAYQSWKRQSKLKVISAEIPLTSQKYKYGGTPDGVVEVNGEVAIVDLKTSNGVYRDYLIQVAAYRQLWQENNPELKVNGGYHILRFAKEGSDFAHHFYPDLSEAWEMFLHLRAAYDLDLALKKRAS